MCGLRDRASEGPQAEGGRLALQMLLPLRTHLAVSVEMTSQPDARLSVETVVSRPHSFGSVGDLVQFVDRSTMRPHLIVETGEHVGKGNRHLTGVGKDTATTTCPTDPVPFSEKV